jgi:hypothetical protein
MVHSGNQSGAVIARDHNFIDAVHKQSQSTKEVTERSWMLGDEPAGQADRGLAGFAVTVLARQRGQPQ